MWLDFDEGKGNYPVRVSLIHINKDKRIYFELYNNLFRGRWAVLPHALAMSLLIFYLNSLLMSLKMLSKFIKLIVVFYQRYRTYYAKSSVWFYLYSKAVWSWFGIWQQCRSCKTRMPKIITVIYCINDCDWKFLWSMLLFYNLKNIYGPFFNITYLSSSLYNQYKYFFLTRKYWPLFDTTYSPLLVVHWTWITIVLFIY